ncbi:tetratricopeptide repeat-containing sensor histidine kinase [Winogradskyella aurantiaca]|uniref:tetratricopeptide repeat-containing sensor histidine kinase n=1 Tax=Winogradskyella aurantiaca TaxID=2219558 RepID=UPI000E1D0AE0|nr:tetratricopeptide repeat-containing sensor histidine kinase [Winogradskyella aurantiaca]
MEKSHFFSFLFFFLGIAFISTISAQVIPRDTILHYAAKLEDPNSNKELIEAYTVFKQVQLDYQKSGVPLGEVYALVHISKAQRKIGDLNDAEQSSIEALRILNTQADSLRDVKKYKTIFYNQLGMLYGELKDYERSRNFYNKSLDFKTGFQDLAIIENNLGYTYTRQKNYAEAIPHFQLAIALLDELGDTSSTTRARSLNNLGFAQVHINQEEGFATMQKALKINKREGYQTGLFVSYKDLTLAYLYTNNQEQARNYANRAYTLVLKTNNTQRLIKAIELQLETGNYSNYQRYKVLNDSITSLQQRNRNQYAALKYSNEQARADANEAQLNFEQAKFEQKRQQGLKLIFILISIILLSGGVLFYFYLRAKNRKKTLLEVMNTESRISQQIHDEVANEVFQMMTRMEEQDLEDPTLVDDMEDLYVKTRDISKEHALIAKQENFADSLQDLVHNFSNDDTRIIINGLSDVNWNKYPPLKREALYKVLQELLINMKKHSKANLVGLRFKEQGKKLGLSYTDNGQGGPINSASGLINAENRMRAVGGSFTFESNDQNGFKAQIYV